MFSTRLCVQVCKPVLKQTRALLADVSAGRWDKVEQTVATAKSTAKKNAANAAANIQAQATSVQPTLGAD